MRANVAGLQARAAILKVAEVEEGAEGKYRIALGLHRGAALIQQDRATGLHQTGLVHLKMWCRLKVNVVVCSQCKSDAGWHGHLCGS